MNIADLNKEDVQAFNQWLDRREAEAIAEQEHWDWIAFGQAEQEARREYFSKHPYEPFDSPDFYFERD